MYSHGMTSHVLIIGGGIAGPVTAMALREAGIDSTVYEAYDQTADGVGAFLGLAPNGLHALRVLGLDEPVRAAGFDSPGLRLTLSGGRTLLETSFTGTRADALPPITIKRADLYATLRDEAVRRGIDIVYGKRLVDAVSDHNTVVARFADGTTAEGDLLIGADGLQSRVRQIIDPTSPAPRYVPFLKYRRLRRGRARGRAGRARESSWRWAGLANHHTEPSGAGVEQPVTPLLGADRLQFGHHPDDVRQARVLRLHGAALAPRPDTDHR